MSDRGTGKESSTGKRFSVLVIAEASNPEWVSVPLIGWSLSRALAEVVDVHIVTHVRNRDAFLRAGLIDGEDFTSIDSDAITGPAWRLSKALRMGSGKGWTIVTALNALTYPYFERLVWKRFGAQIKAGNYDVVHRITPLTPTTVSPLAAKCKRAGVPMIIGPLNGGVPWPAGFDSERRREREWLSYVRGAYKLLPGRRRMLNSCAAIIVGSRHTESEIPQKYSDKCVYIPENAIDPARFEARSPQSVQGVLRAVFIGRLVPYKGADMALLAASELLASGRMQFDIIGDGPMRSELEALVSERGLEQAVTFHGQIPHKDVQTIASRSNILMFPSIREFGGGVVLEAMAMGVVPIVVDYAGPGELVTQETGIKVPIGRRGQIVDDLRDVLSQIDADRNVLKHLSKSAMARAADIFTWQAKARQIVCVYEWATGLKKEKPAPLDD